MHHMGFVFVVMRQRLVLFPWIEAPTSQHAIRLAGHLIDGPMVSNSLFSAVAIQTLCSQRRGYGSKQLYIILLTTHPRTIN
jgi:hypothetical protein